MQIVQYSLIIAFSHDTKYVHTIAVALLFGNITCCTVFYQQLTDLKCSMLLLRLHISFATYSKDEMLGHTLTWFSRIKC